MLLADTVNHYIHYLRILRSQIVVLVDIGAEVVQFRFATLHHEFPIAHAEAYLICFVKFPVKEIMLLLTGFSEQSRGKRDTVEVINLLVRINIGCGEVFNTCEVAECRHHIVECKLMVIDRTGLNLSGPAYDEWYTYATLVT